MNTKLQKLLEVTWIKWLWTMKSEAVLLLLALSLFFNLAHWLRGADSTAASLDLGVISFVALGLITVVAGLILFWVIVRVIAPIVDSWFDGDDPDIKDTFETDWISVSPAVRICVFFGTLCAVLIAVALATMAAF